MNRALSCIPLLALPLLAVAACAPPPGDPPPIPLAQARAAPAPEASPPRRMPFTVTQPLGLSRPGEQRAAAGHEPAPIPNRAIEAPPSRVADAHAASLEPFLLPPERRPGMTFGREHLRETGPDRPFDNILPGARLRIPFEGSTGR